ncbi:MAG: DEAD/DEAH box helicase [Verrucomicrobiota bacterium]
MPFTVLGLDARIVQAVQDAGYTEPTPIQAAAIPVILTGSDVIGIAQTGTGKTAAFTLPLLTRMAASASERRGTKALILAPTRELAFQIEENVRAYAKHLKLSIATVFGGVGERPQIQSLRAGVDMIIACPGRLLDLLGQGHGDFSGIEYLILDEADRMLDMGFLPSIRRIVRGLPGKRQTLLFSATLSKEIETLTKEFQHSPKMVQVGRRSNPAETVAQWVYEVPAHLKPALLAQLLNDPAMNSVLVFTRTKHGADRIAKRLEQSGVTCGTLHSNRSQNQRLRALKDFRDGAVRVLVATDIAARGIDVDGISHVVNFDFPPHAEDYVHRIGRTGRAQAIGDAISFVSSEDQGALRDLERFIGRGILRKKAEDFDLSAPAPPRPPAPPGRNQRPQPRRDGAQGGQGGGGGGGRNNGGGGRSGQQQQPRGPQPQRPRPEQPARPASDDQAWRPGDSAAAADSAPRGRRSRR